MNPRDTLPTLRTLRTTVLLVALVLLAAAAQAAAPTRVARLGYLDGEVSLMEAGTTDWVQAPLNQPLMPGDQLWTAPSGGAELQLEGTALRMGEDSRLNLLILDERTTQLQLSEGALRLRVRALEPDQRIEVDTPNLAFVVRRTGDYRIEVDARDGATLVLVQSGLAEVFGGGASYRVDSSQAYRFYGTSLSAYEGVSGYRADGLDRWAEERERRLDQSASARFVPAGVVGYEDLDANGRWVVDSTYGNVWLPSRVDAGWTPFRDGRWTWVDPWGWTWIDNAPWGYAVSHYGRWAFFGNAWGWVPGAKREPVVYAPALVGFVGGEHGRPPAHRRDGIGSSGWFPLGPREAYRPGQAPAREGYVNQHIRGAVVVTSNPAPRERAPDARAPDIRAPDFGVRIRPPRDIRPVPPPVAPPTAAAPRVETQPVEAPKNDIRRNDFLRGEPARGERFRNDAAKADAAKADAANMSAMQAAAAQARAVQEQAARAQQDPQRGQQDADPNRRNAHRPDKERTPEEDLLMRGRRKP
jgi:hypothetical protein